MVGWMVREGRIMTIVRPVRDQNHAEKAGCKCNPHLGATPVPSNTSTSRWRETHTTHRHTHGLEGEESDMLALWLAIVVPSK